MNLAFGVMVPVPPGRTHSARTTLGSFSCDMVASLTSKIGMKSQPKGRFEVGSGRVCGPEY